MQADIQNVLRRLLTQYNRTNMNNIYLEKLLLVLLLGMIILGAMVLLAKFFDLTDDEYSFFQGYIVGLATVTLLFVTALLI